MLVQLVAYISPPQPSLATSANDIIHGGGTKAEILSAYRTDVDGLGRRDIKEIFDYFLGAGAADAAIENGVEEAIVSTEATNYWSVGRSLRDSNDITLAVPGAETEIYQRTLHGWPGANGTSWSAIRVTSAINGQEMWILKDCGNIVTKGPFTPANPTPRLKKVSTPVPGSAVKPGDTIEYGLVYGNAGPGSMLDTNLYDEVPANTTYTEGTIGGGVNEINNGTLHWWPNTPGKVWGVDGNDWPVWFRVTVNQGVADGTQICNDNARITWKEGGAEKIITTEPICHIVSLDKCPDGSVKPASGECPVPPPPTCPDGSVQPADGICRRECDVNGTITYIPYENDCPKPRQTVVCSALQEVSPISHRTRRSFKAKATATNGGTVAEFQFDHDNDGKNYKIIPAVDGEAIFEYEYPDDPAAKTYASKIFVKAEANGETNITSNSVCELAVSIPAQPAPKSPLLTRSKKVTNKTQKIEDANGTTAKAGDEITYTLITKNIGDGDAIDYTLAPEDLKDVLEYADVTDLQDAILNTESKKLSWTNVTIRSGKEIVKTFTVKVKNPIPTTPVSTSDVRSFDLVMQNSYGNDTSVKLPAPPAKQVEGIAKSLPDTGPTSGLFIGFLVTTLVAYFFARSRLLARELDMVRAEYASGVY
jgi:uncharacterized repeat protein (TIGR01451 family)